MGEPLRADGVRRVRIARSHLLETTMQLRTAIKKIPEAAKETVAFLRDLPTSVLAEIVVGTTVLAANATYQSCLRGPPRKGSVRIGGTNPRGKNARYIHGPAASVVRIALRVTA
jgi:hypothetical protein